MNIVIINGNLVRDPELRKTGNDKSVASFTVAVTRSYKSEGGPEADFIRCVAFGKQAEFIEKYFQKGKKIIIEGRIQTGSYDDKDGKKVFTTDIVVERAEFGERKSGSEAGNVPAPSSAPSAPPVAPVDEEDGDDMPF
jgi:single-strand DNA-binding protein